jgi:DNA-binding MarR family transcriptional regulator
MAQQPARQKKIAKGADPSLFGEEMLAMPGHLIRRMHQVSQVIFDSHVAGAGYELTSVQFAALTVIAAQPGLDQATLAREISFDRATTGGVIERLETKGLIRREVSAQDRRARQLYLERAGEEMLANVMPLARDAQRMMLSGLNAAERAQFLQLIDKALAHVGDASRPARGS